jgi:hypothetical protein
MWLDLWRLRVRRICAAAMTARSVQPAVGRRLLAAWRRQPPRLRRAMSEANLPGTPLRVMVARESAPRHRRASGDRCGRVARLVRTAPEAGVPRRLMSGSGDGTVPNDRSRDQESPERQSILKTPRPVCGGGLVACTNACPAGRRSRVGSGRRCVAWGPARWFARAVTDGVFRVYVEDVVLTSDCVDVGSAG